MPGSAVVLFLSLFWSDYQSYMKCFYLHLGTELFILLEIHMKIDF